MLVGQEFVLVQQVVERVGEINGSTGGIYTTVHTAPRLVGCLMLEAAPLHCCLLLPATGCHAGSEMCQAFTAAAPSASVIRQIFGIDTALRHSRDGSTGTRSHNA